MKPFLLICTMWLVASCPSWARDQDDRFLEFPGNNYTMVYDLNSVKIIGPGKFTIIGTTTDNRDVMNFRLKVIQTLHDHCKRPAGKYPAPPDLLTLGPSDMPVENIEVEGAGVSWLLPYKRLAFGSKPSEQLLRCEDYSEWWASITNGVRMIELYDCKRGLHGVLHDDKDDPAKAITGFVRNNGSKSFEYYLRVCLRVTHESPYEPE